MLGHFEFCVNLTNLRTFRELHDGSEVVAEVIQITCCDENFVVRLQRVHEVEGAHIENVFT